MSILLIIFVATGVYEFIFGPHLKIEKFGHYTFDDFNKYDNIPFNYMLSDDQNNHTLITPFVNQYLVLGNYVYFSEVDGGIEDGYCYHDNRLGLSRINMLDNHLERFINEKKYPYTEIFNKLKDISEKDSEYMQVLDKCKNPTPELYKPTPELYK